MYCRVLACDFDGTGAADGHLVPEVSAALEAARAVGILTLLVTGRVLDDLAAQDIVFGSFDAVVAENGAVVRLTASGRTIILGAPPPAALLGELHRRGVPFHAGAVVVGTWDRYAPTVLEIIRQTGTDSQLIFNRAAVMVLPSGINKATGVHRALVELGRSERNLVAFGDAENDRPLLDVAEIGIAVRESVPALAAAADVGLTRPGATGVAHYVHGLLEAGGIVPTPPRRRVLLGHDLAGGEVRFPSSGTDVMITGDPRAGKSWLAGLVAERLIDADYRLCLIDPEGDHAALGARPHVLLLGQDLPLPEPGSLPRVLRDEPLSVILSLASLRARDKLPYVNGVLCALGEARTDSGIPHWFVIDEAHYFFRPRSSCCGCIGRRTGNHVLVTYRPSLVAPEVSASTGAYLVTETGVEEERYFVTGLLQTRGPRDLHTHDALAAVTARRVGLLTVNGEGEGHWQVFVPDERAVAHTHHARKYADGSLPEEKAFRFQATNGVPMPVAHNLHEFCAAVRAVPIESLRRHLHAGDFSRWVSDVLGDQGLARGFAKLEQTERAGAPPSREEIVAHVRDRYLIE